MEASGTSGMKVIPNGGLNLSVLDGWWCEAYETDAGWAIGGGEVYEDPNYQDDVESKGLFDTLENDIVPLFYDRSSDDLPRGWIAKMKGSMKKLGPAFNTNRMVREYAERFYLRANKNWERLSADGYRQAIELAGWKENIQRYWDKVRITGAQLERREADVGYALKVEVEVQLGALSHDDVIVQIYTGPLDREGNIISGITENAKYVGPVRDGLHRYEGHIASDESGLFGYSIRIVPYHLNLTEHYGLEMMRWISDSAGRLSPVTHQAEERVVVS
jgi:starch phosphorylase